MLHTSFLIQNMITTNNIYQFFEYLTAFTQIRTLTDGQIDKLNTQTLFNYIGKF